MRKGLRSRASIMIRSKASLRKGSSPVQDVVHQPARRCSGDSRHNGRRYDSGLVVNRSCGRVALGGCPPRAPTDPYVDTLDHTVPQVTPSPRHNLTSAVTNPYLLSVPISVTPRGSSKSSGCCLPTGELLDASLPIPRVLAGRVPRLHRYYQGTATSCRPSRRASFPSFGGATGSRTFRSRGGCVNAARGPGVVRPVSPSGTASMETTGAPKFLGNPNSCLHMFFDPGRPMRP
jgi:hypothetical protein